MRNLSYPTLILLSLLLCLSLASGFEIAEPRLIFDGNDVRYLSAGGRVVDLSFEVTDYDQATDFSIDYSSFFPAAPPDYSSRASFDIRTSPNCAAVEGDRLCVFRRLVLKTDEQEVTMNVSASEEGVRQWRTHTFSFVTDDTSPRLVSITPQRCEEDVCEEQCLEDECYVSDGYTQLALSFDDSEASFHRGRVAFHYGSSTARVYDCEGLTCYGLARTLCDDEDLVKASIARDSFGYSSDDAGNRIIEEKASVFTCDATAPSIIESSFGLATASGADTRLPGVEVPVVAIGEEVTLTFNVTESTSPSLRVVLHAEEAGVQDSVEGSCERAEGDRWSCSVSFAPAPEAAVEEARLRVEVSDLTGHSSSAWYELSVFGISSEQADFWEVAPPARQQANKHYLEYAPKQVFLPLVVRSDREDVRLLDAKAGSCSATVKNEKKGTARGTDADLRFDVLSHEAGMVLLRGDLNMGSHYTDHSYVEYECSLELSSLRGTSFVNAPETANFTVRFDLYDSSTIGEQVQEEIIDLRNGTLENLRWLGMVQKALDAVQLACRIGPALKSVGTDFNALGTVFTGTNEEVAQLYTNAGKGAQAFAEEGNKLLNGACKALTCDSKLVEGVLGDTGLMKAVESAGFSGNQILNPYDSWLASLMTMCLPAMSQHMSNYMGIQCDYVACLSKDVPEGGASLEMCQQRKGYATCDMFAGGLYNAVPFYGLAKDIVGETINVLRDPVSLYSSAGVIAPCVAASLAETGPFDSIMTRTCYALKGVTGIAESAQQMVQMSNQIRSMFTSGSFGQSSCDQVLKRLDVATTYWDYGYEAEAEVDENALFRVYKDGKELPVDSEQHQALAAGKLDKLLKEGYTVGSPWQGYTSRVGGNTVTTFSLGDGAHETFINGKKADNYEKVTADMVEAWRDVADQEVAEYEKKAWDQLVETYADLHKEFMSSSTKKGDSVYDAYQEMQKVIADDFGAYVATLPESRKTGGIILSDKELQEDIGKIIREHEEEFDLKTIYSQLERVDNDIKSTNPDLAESSNAFVGLIDDSREYERMKKDVSSLEGDYLLEAPEEDELPFILVRDEEGNLQQVQKLNALASEDFEENLAGADDYRAKVLDPQFKGDRSELAEVYDNYVRTKLEHQRRLEDLKGELTSVSGMVKNLDSYDEAQRYVDEEWADDARSLSDKAERLLDNSRTADLLKDEIGCEDDCTDSEVQEFMKAVVRGEKDLSFGQGADIRLQRFQRKVEAASDKYNNYEKIKGSVDGYMDLQFNNEEDPDTGEPSTIMELGLEENVKNVLAYLGENDYVSRKELEELESLDLTKPADREKLLDVLEEAEKEMSDAVEELEEEEDTGAEVLEAQSYLDKHWKGAGIIGSLYASFSTANAFTNGLANQDLTSIGWSEDGTSGYDQTMARISSAVESGLETATCKASGAYGEGSGSLKLTASNDRGSLYSSAAFVAGLRVVERSTGERGYSYLLNVYAANERDVQENLSFRVWLRGEGEPGVKVPLVEDDEGELLYSFELPYGEDTAQWSGAQYLHYPYEEGEVTSAEYDEVCIEFLNDDYELWFDVSRKRQAEFCRRLDEG